jgi:hypothetical protein
MAEQILYNSLKDLHRYVPMPPHDEGGPFFAEQNNHENTKKLKHEMEICIFVSSEFRAFVMDVFSFLENVWHFGLGDLQPAMALSL